ncbi:hypothetical protein AOC36_07480 [Erysipelothrix larvae]|uniref:Uncharacterized protein n=1 Tax=Erysipelothrix larvae TaxID=1514105 RepID=A0A0X8H0M7_9FIRM|nr:hypothetical protein [Erysipelothrix larvae]AMC93830.1 hypothetical protein AOC36_07480 [Erysipelothrix larvae]
MFTNGLKSILTKGVIGVVAVGVLTFSGITWDGQEGIDGVRDTVENLVNKVYGLNNDRNQLLGHIGLLNSQYASLNARYTELYELKLTLLEENSELAAQLELTIEELRRDLESVRAELEIANQQLEAATEAIEAGQVEINRLEGELSSANQSVDALTREVEELLRRIEGITPGVDIPGIGDSDSSGEESIYEAARNALLAANIPGITDNVLVYIGSETSYNIRFRVVDTTGDPLWTDDWGNIQQVIDIIRTVYGGSNAWAMYPENGAASIYVQK